MSALSFNDLFTPTPPISSALPPLQAVAGDDDARRYALSALSAEANILAATSEGSRNHQLNTSAFNLAQLIPHISETEIIDHLKPIALSIGLTTSETVSTLRSGINAGRKQPRSIPQLAGSYVELGDSKSVSFDSRVKDFWDSRLILHHIQTFAYSRMASPWAVLGCCLLRAVTSMPPHIVTPPIIGGVGSLNMLLALVAPSGSGKGAAEAAAKAAVMWPHQNTVPLGSGEGITHAYASPLTKKEKEENPGDDLKWHTKAIYFTATELDQLTAIQSRRGSTLMPQLRAAYSGEALGFQYADLTRRIILPAHSYRFTLSIGVQPLKAAPLIDDGAGGTPQRFFWMPATDPTISMVAPDPPPPWRWVPPLTDPNHAVANITRDNYGHTILNVPNMVATTIRQAQVDRNQGKIDALDGHALYTQLKIAHALAFLNQQPTISEEDWQLAEIVMRVSDSTRARIEARLKCEAEEEQYRRAVSQACTQETVELELEERAIKRVSMKVCTYLSGAVLTRSQARKRLVSRDRKFFDAAVTRLEETGKIEGFIQDGKEYLRLSDRQ